MTAEDSAKQASLKELQVIPGIGRAIAAKLYDLGVRSPADLKGADPEHLYQQLTIMKGRHIDRCLLYVFRCAVYYSSNSEHDPEKLKWWNWKDR